MIEWESLYIIIVVIIIIIITIIIIVMSHVWIKCMEGLATVPSY